MVLKLNTKVEFCGEKRRFQRCPNRTLKDYQRSMEDIQDKITPLADKSKEYQYKLKEIQSRIDGIDEYVDLVKGFSNASDDEMREVMSMIKRKNDYTQELNQLRREFEDYEQDNRKIFEELDEDLRLSYGEFASKIFEDFKVDDIDEADSTDLTIAPRLSELYRLATTGAKQSEIDEAYKNIVKDSFQ